MAKCVMWTLYLTLYSITAASAALKNTLSYSVVENTPGDTLVADIAADSGLLDVYSEEISQLLRLSFIDEATEASALFKINQGHQLVTAQTVDRDVVCSSKKDCVLELDLQVNPPRYFYIFKVSIRINDTNDNAPVFPQDSITRVVSESAGIGSVIPIPTATDADSPRYGIQRYSLEDPSGTFDLKFTNTSEEIQDLYLSVQSKLDREDTEMYEVEVRAFDSADQMGSVKVTVQVQDINDNPPVFTEQMYEFSVVEDVERLAEVGRILANDADTGVYGAVRYGLSDDTFASVFHVNASTGAITVVGDLDRETQESYTLGVTAQNEDVNSLPTLGKVIIHILDINDNAPTAKIRGSVDDRTVEISESVDPGTFVAHITVTDPDLRENGSFSCSVHPAEHFELIRMFETEFKLSSKQVLDRETNATHTIEVTCVDEGVPEQRSIKEVIIVLQDVNDNAPQFLELMYSTSVLENNPVGEFLLQVQAVDPDEGKDGEVRYQFENGSNADHLLQLDPISGRITANDSFDHEAIVTHRIEAQVLAYDRGDTPNLSRVSVYIDIIDQDDEKPVFDKPVYSLGVYEDEPVRTEVGIVHAEDKDSDFFNKFQYEISYEEQDANAFTVDSNTGQIYTSERLDRETKSEYQFTVKAVSGGLHPKSSTTLVHVYVADINDNSPRILYPSFKNSTVHISNKVPRLSTITTVLAEDADAGANAQVSFILVSGNEDGYFSMDEHTGALVLEKDLSHIGHGLFGLVVGARDHGTPPKTSEGYLNIIVNKSLASPGSGLMPKQNLTIVIAIATISGLVMVLLLVAIAAIVRYPRLVVCISDKNKKYNQNARMIDRQKMQNSQKSGPECTGNLKKDSFHNGQVLSPQTPGGGGGGGGGEEVDLSFVNLSFQDEVIEASPPQAGTMGSHKEARCTPGFQGQGQRSDDTSASLPPRDYPKATAVLSSQHPPQKTSVSQSDTDSACSADLSNVTDSGRGSHGSNEDAAIPEATPTNPATGVKQIHQGHHEEHQHHRHHPKQDHHYHHKHQEYPHHYQNHHHHNHHQYHRRPCPPDYGKLPAKQTIHNVVPNSGRNSRDWKSLPPEPPSEQPMGDSREDIHGKGHHLGDIMPHLGLVSPVSDEVHV